MEILFLGTERYHISIDEILKVKERMKQLNMTSGETVLWQLTFLTAVDFFTTN